MDITKKDQSCRGLAKRIMRHPSIYFFIIIFTTFAIGCIEGEPSQNVSDTPPDDQNNSGANITENVEKTLVGHQIVYYDIAGEPRYYNISKKDIRNIEKSESDGEVIWIVTVGSGMQWEIHLNSTGESILKEIQLFRT
ncbi:hypothetical protein FTO70_02075 [Methanosarcina sp. KYL-1]|uniref:hypothetical protein n=1 Tax=Methanosarcina sp. KYL-1 TaxID=2602068 RepID=UPI002100E736|nr:hypothetical protein [Methanosarcina sp. KYL-1]MCQ1534502.1 hypothetical protein [Methanosarcina sp. KYL-1]